MEVREEKVVKKWGRFMLYLSFKAASPGACVWFALLVAGGRGPLSWVLSGAFFRMHRNLYQGKDSQRGVAAAADMEGHTWRKDSGGQRKGKEGVRGLSLLTTAMLTHIHQSRSSSVFQQEHFPGTHLS